MRTSIQDLADMGGYDVPEEEWAGYFMYVSARDDGNDYINDISTLSTEMHPRAWMGCMSFEFSLFVSKY